MPSMSLCRPLRPGNSGGLRWRSAATICLPRFHLLGGGTDWKTLPSKLPALKRLRRPK